MLHTKLLVVDGEFVSVGSTNFDMGSLKLNDEASLNIYDTAFAGEMTRAFEEDLARSSINARRGGPVPSGSGFRNSSPGHPGL